MEEETEIEYRIDEDVEIPEEEEMHALIESLKNNKSLWRNQITAENIKTVARL